MAARRVSSSPAFVKYVASGLGPVSALDGPLFDSAHYTPLPNSRRSEAQTVKEFASDEDRNPITTDRRLILFRLGEGVESSLLSAVSAWLAVFFPSMIITVMDLNMRPGNGRRPSYIVKTPAGEISVRVRGKAQQLNVLDLIDAVIYSLPAGAYCGCAVTMHDMYESADDEFICGRAFGGSRAAVVSCYRYTLRSCPLVVGEEEVGDPVARRVSATVAHEVGHCFGLDHCQYFKCAMNESNSIEEDVTAFFDLCPVDLMKLCTSVGVKPRERWEGMLAYLTSLGEGSKGDVEWLTRRLSALGALPNAPAAAAASAASSRKRTRN